MKTHSRVCVLRQLYAVQCYRSSRELRWRLVSLTSASSSHGSSPSAGRQLAWILTVFCLTVLNLGGDKRKICFRASACTDIGIVSGRALWLRSLCLATPSPEVGQNDQVAFSIIRQMLVVSGIEAYQGLAVPRTCSGRYACRVRRRPIQKTYWFEHLYSAPKRFFLETTSAQNGSRTVHFCPKGVLEMSLVPKKCSTAAQKVFRNSHSCSCPKSFLKNTLLPRKAALKPRLHLCFIQRSSQMRTHDKQVNSA